MNSNPKIDEIKYNMLAYTGGIDVFNILQVLLRTRFSKGKNVILSQTNPKQSHS